MGYKKELRRQQREHAELVFHYAVQLYRYLGAGGLLQSAAGDPRLPDGEGLVLETVYNVGRFRGADVSYTVPGYFAMGRPAFVFGAMLGDLAARRAARRRAEQEAAPRWRFFGPHTCLLTSSRVLFLLDGGWEGGQISTLHDIQPDLAAHCLDVFYGNEPIRLLGPAAPWQSVAMLYLKHGVAGLHHPALRELARS